MKNKNENKMKFYFLFVITVFFLLPLNRTLAQTYTGVRALTGGNDMNYIFLDKPDSLISYGTTIPNYFSAISAEYYNGLYYVTSSDYGYAYQLYTVNSFSGEVTSKINGVNYAIISYNPQDGKMYGISYGQNSCLYTVDISTGVGTFIDSLATDVFVCSMVITNDGRFIVLDTEADAIYELNKSTGTFTELIKLTQDAVSVQDMSCDRRTNQIYWQNCYRQYGYSFTALRSIDLETKTVETVQGISHGCYCCFALQTSVDATIPDFPKNFTAQQTTGLNVQLSWTNPSLSGTGATLANISSIRILRDKKLIHTINNPVPGANITWTDNTIPK